MSAMFRSAKTYTSDSITTEEAELQTGDIARRKYTSSSKGFPVLTNARHWSRDQQE